MTLFITTKASDYYHASDECAAFQAGRRGSEHAGYTLHPVQEMSEADAQRSGKTPCGQCVTP